MKKQTQSGFAIVEIIIVLVVIVALAGVGYYVWQKHKTTTAATIPTSSSTSYQSPPVATPSAPQVTNATDLNTAMKALNQTSISSSNTDSSQLTTQASGF